VEVRFREGHSYSLAGGVKHVAYKVFGGDVHLFWLPVADNDAAVFGEGKWDGRLAAVLQVTLGEAEPAVVDAESDVAGGNLDDGVVGAVEAVGGCVAAQQGSPGGPEFGVETVVQFLSSGVVKRSSSKLGLMSFCSRYWTRRLWEDQMLPSARAVSRLMWGELVILDEPD